MGLSLKARATRSFNSFGVVADNDLQSVLDLRLQFSYSNLSVLPGTTRFFLGITHCGPAGPCCLGSSNHSPQCIMSASTTRVFALSRDELGAQYRRATLAS